MDVWSINEKLKQEKEKREFLETRVTHIESFLIQLTEEKKDEKVQDKSNKSSGVRSRRRTTKKSKSKK